MGFHYENIIIEELEGQSRLREERWPYSSGRPARGEDSRSINRVVDCRATPLGGRETKVDPTRAMMQYYYASLAIVWNYSQGPASGEGSSRRQMAAGIRNSPPIE